MTEVRDGDVVVHIDECVRTSFGRDAEDIDSQLVAASLRREQWVRDRVAAGRITIDDGRGARTYVCPADATVEKIDPPGPALTNIGIAGMPGTYRRCYNPLVIRGATRSGPGCLRDAMEESVADRRDALRGHGGNE